MMNIIAKNFNILATILTVLCFDDFNKINFKFTSRILDLSTKAFFLYMSRNQVTRILLDES